jgi:hypothetical protein
MLLKLVASVSEERIVSIFNVITDAILSSGTLVTTYTASKPRRLRSTV